MFYSLSLQHHSNAGVPAEIRGASKLSTSNRVDMFFREVGPEI
jgi:hypothetical protein